MTEHDGLDGFRAPASGTTLTIGNFDGVHRGHQHMVQTARRVASELGTPLVVLTFEPHPLAVLAPGRAPARLTTLEEKLALLARLGADDAVVLQSTPELLAQRALEFLAGLVARCQPRALVEGATFNFGRRREGSVQTLADYAQEGGYRLVVVETLRADELAGAPAVNSSAVRAALHEGQVDAARTMLGRPFRVSGVVGHGAARGKALGFPTANLTEVPQVLPQFGVYAAAAQLSDDDEFHLAAVNIGPQPTFDDPTPRVEAFLLDYQGDVRGRRLGLHFFQRLRGQQKFSGPDELVRQVERDVQQTRAFAPELASLAGAALPL